MKDNIFLKLGRWLARESLVERVAHLEAALSAHTVATSALSAEKAELEKIVKELKDRLMKVEMHVGFFVQPNTKEGVKATLDAWQRISPPTLGK